ncbi:25399_t:CDS:2, partial [Gigaspora rosea]
TLYVESTTLFDRLIDCKKRQLAQDKSSVHWYKMQLELEAILIVTQYVESTTTIRSIVNNVI